MATTGKSNVVKHPSSKDAPVKAKVKKPAAEKKGFEKVVLMKYSKDTKGAYIYTAVTDSGKPLGQEDTVAPSVYFRKSHMPSNPEFLEVSIRQIPGLTAKPKVKTPEVEDGEDD